MNEELSLPVDGHQIHITRYGEFSRGVLLCPPHPEYGGSRKDSRLVTIADELTTSDISALSFDYPVYTGGTEEVKDTLLALEYMSKTMTSLGLLGYSYGAVVASNAATQFPNLKGLVLISPLRKIDGLKIELGSDCDKMIIYGSHDRFIAADIDRIYDLARGKKRRLSLNTDHFYAGYEIVLASAVREFFQNVFQN